MRLSNYRQFDEARKRPPEGLANLYRIWPEFDKSHGGYVGATTMSMVDRLDHHLEKKSRCREMREAVAAHGRDCFRVDILGTVPAADKYTEEKKLMAKYNSVENGYNSLPGANVSDPDARAAHKAIMNKPEVKARRKELATDQWKPGGSLRENWHESFAQTAATPEFKALRTKVAKEIRSRPELEIQRGLAKRATTLRKRAEKRAALKTEKERRAFDAEIRKRDKYLAKTGMSKVQARALGSSA